jgi:formate dehydrogenase iron-sulfur subunit
MTPATIDDSTVRSTLVDIGNCIGCRACQVACKQWNDKDGETTTLEDTLGFQNPAMLSAKTLTLITFHEMINDKAQGGVDYAFAMRRCLHCLEPACASACPTQALFRQDDGPVTYTEDRCIGCRYCVWACPWGVPMAEWDSLAPKISKCTHCADRTDQPLPQARNGTPLNSEESQRYKDSIAVPACVKACPADALKYGTREEMLTEAKRRIARTPGKYVDHIYGEHEAGGTSVLYISKVPFEQLGFPMLSDEPYPATSAAALGAVPPAVIVLGAVFGGVYSFFKRRTDAAARESAHDFHPAFEVLKGKLLTPFNWAMLALVALGVLSIVSRFFRGLGASTNLSNSYPWGLWIAFDLIWIALAAGAFATAGIIYIFQRKDLYSLGRSAVLLGFLSYSFVTVTLIADLGLPWHAYQLALQAPEHSAMFEVSWCVGLYVSILLLEFLPVPLERYGYSKTLAAWRKWQGAYVAFAVTLFVYLMSRNAGYAIGAAVVFGALAWIFRARDEHPEPILLAIAAVTLSTMHQSSLGSLFLLMPDKLGPQWWSPVMPISFFLSAIAAGTAVVILVEMAIARSWHRPLRMPQLAAMGEITFWSLAAYLVFRLGDMAVRGQFSGAFSGTAGMLFITEIVVGGVVPLVMLAKQSQRLHQRTLLIAAALVAAGITFNRVNVVLLAMNIKGPMPQFAAEIYYPSPVEWGISIGLIAATVFLFGLAVRLLPLLPAADAGHEAAH